MRYFLDTEFNGFGGDLISLALVPEIEPNRPDRGSFYCVLPYPEMIDPWVAKHVIPYLGPHETITRLRAADALARYLKRTDSPIIVADWPSDFEHLMRLLITGPGFMAPAPDFGMEFCRMPGFDTATRSKIPHNALADAEALRDEWIKRRIRDCAF